MAELSGNEILARCLKAQGVKDIFFIMGGPMLDAELCSIKEGIRLIDTRHEQTASHAADGWSRVTGQPGVAVVTAGPGLTDAVTGVASAWRASISAVAHQDSESGSNLALITMLSIAVMG